MSNTNREHQLQVRMCSSHDDQVAVKYPLKRVYNARPGSKRGSLAYDKRMIAARMEPSEHHGHTVPGERLFPLGGE